MAATKPPLEKCLDEMPFTANGLPLEYPPPKTAQFVLSSTYGQHNKLTNLEHSFMKLVEETLDGLWRTKEDLR